MSQMIQPDFIVIPTQLLSDESLQPSDRILFGYIYWMEKMALMKCIATNKTLSSLTGFSERAIRLSLTRLEQQGYIGRIYRGENAYYREQIVCKVAFSSTGGTNVPGGRNKRSPIIRKTK